MKKTQFLLLLAIIAVSTNLFVSCKDDFTEEDAINLNRQYDEEDNLVEYTLLVVNASTSTIAKSASKNQSVISGAIITLTQDGTVLSDSTDASGMVVFSNIKAGTVAVTISKSGYSEVALIANLDSLSSTGGGKASNLIPMIPITSVTGTIKGQVTYESDLTNKVKEVASGVKVIAKVSTSSPALANAKQGVIEQISYAGLTLEATTDSNGNYEMAVPSTANGLDYEVSVSDFEDDQTLYMPTYNGEEVETAAEVKRTLSAVFGSNGNLSSYETDIVPAFISFSAPTATGKGAAATAVIGNNKGIQSINLLNSGSKYTDGTYYLSVDNAAANAEAQLKVNINNGIITYVDVTSNGDNYAANIIKFNQQYESFEAYPYVDGSGTITGIDINNYGRFLLGNDHLGMLSVKISGGTGAVISISSMSYTSGGYYPSSIIVNNGGTGYEATDKITVTVNGITSSDVASGQINLTSGSVFAIQMTNAGSGYTAGNVYVAATGGGGQGFKTGTVSVEDGKIDYITVSDGGYGYATAPTIEIYDLTTLKKATLKLSTSDFDSDGSFASKYYAVDSCGSGYITPPTVTISAVGSGSGAAALAKTNSSGQVEGIYMTNRGSSYKAENYVSSNVSVSAQSLSITGTQDRVLNIYLGQGKRSIEK
jgi:hypothetical protein